MRHRTTASRRDFLSAAPKLAIAAALYAPCASTAPAIDRLVARLSRLFRDAHGAPRVGRAFLAANPQEADVHRLVRSIVGDHAPFQEIDRLGEAALRQFVSARLQRDFQTGSVVVVSGWLLSLTEARLSALALLTAAAT